MRIKAFMTIMALIPTMTSYIAIDKWLWLYIEALTLVGFVILDIIIVMTLKTVMAIMAKMVMKAVMATLVVIMDIMVLMTSCFDGYNFSNSSSSCVVSNDPH